MNMLALFAALLVAVVNPSTHHLAATSKGYATCESHYYYVVQPQSSSPHHHPLLDTFAKVAAEYEVTVVEVAEYNPLAVGLATLPLGMSICVPRDYPGSGS